MVVNVTDIDITTMHFLVFQAHSQNRYIILSFDIRNPYQDKYVNATDPGLVLTLDDLSVLESNSTKVMLSNCHKKNLTVLFMVRNYTRQEPIPGKYKAVGTPEPFLTLMPNILTTKATYRAALLPGTNSVEVEGELRYRTYLTYMYERDLSEAKYWDTLVATSTLQGLQMNAKLVLERQNNNTAEYLSNWFVSYSGVGAVITVVVSYNNSNGSLYSSSVSYGCDFIDAEEYTCTKLVNPLAKLFCASLIFVGLILLFLGHRWLNFTMFTSGFLFSWCVLFLLFAQASSNNVDALGWGTLVGAVLGGILWLLVWHKFRRPFHSALLIIVMTIIFVGMTVTFFIRYAIMPRDNIAAFVVFPAFFALIIIGYSIVNIKKVHIFSCALLGSYAFMVPPAFYLGSSLTYIVINVIALLTVEHYSDTLGYPPFQVWDIVLLCLWILLFVAGMVFQLYRERSSPPFYPPNLTWWEDTKKAINFVLDVTLRCLPLDPDPGGAGIEERPTWLLRLTYTFRLFRRRLPCANPDLSESGYQSFQQVRQISQSAESLATNTHSSTSSLSENRQSSRLAVFQERTRDWVQKLPARFRKKRERLVEVETEEGQGEDEARLLDGQA
ncbi:hypothetical protein Pmani_034553 [Petrolisthes manimaculis]|uniref:TM7S3/TM198-like domain-containing protein n=1 Tax=Petrolisthes manimaculis TaxID=1843537 RepID=A0AAE1NPT1_9EUCA|nr:hypothetical protein Pmani_034553 [Petrolisthes manimaculis]